MIQIIGGGLAGSEAAWQAARRGVPVTLHEMRPLRTTRVHQTAQLAELVCSNSFRGDKLENAVGLLKAEMRQLESLIIHVADRSRVPAGVALAVDRDRFAAGVTDALERHPLVTIRRGEIPHLPEMTSTDTPTIIATGPLTSESLSADIATLVGHEHLYFYDAISPIVLAETIDRSKVFRASRWGRDTKAESESERARWDVDNPVGDYLNCPLSETEYLSFYEALIGAEVAELHDFDRTPFFEGCLPIEVMAHRGLDTLRFGPMKPVGAYRSSTWPSAARRGATPPGQPGCRPLQSCGISDPAQVGRPAPRDQISPRSRRSRVRSVWNDSPQHVH